MSYTEQAEPARFPGWQWASTEGRENAQREVVRVWEPTETGEMGPAGVVVASGVGSASLSTATTAAEAAIARLERVPWSRMQRAMEDAAEAANLAIADGKDNGTLHENGATALLLVALTDREVLWWSAGNSLLYVLPASGDPIRLLNDPAGTKISPMTPAVALMGMPFEMPPGLDDEVGTDVERCEKPVPLEPGDLVIAATAGIAALDERETAKTLRGALATGVNCADELVRSMVFAEMPTRYAVSVAVRQTAPATNREQQEGKRAKHRVFHGRIGGGCKVRSDQRELEPETSRRVKDLSPRFGWGYRGNGPRQLALALLLEVTGSRDVALGAYDALHEERIARMVGREWTLTEGDLLDWLYERQRRKDVSANASTGTSPSATPRS